LIAQAEVEAGRREISASEALLRIIERAEDQELIIKAFSRPKDTSGQASSEKAAMAAYLDASG
jgi:hypothetical protein